MLDLGSEGVIPFELVAKDADVLADNSGNAHMTWLALSPLATQRPMGFKGTGAMASTGKFNLVQQGAGGTMYRSEKIAGNKGCASQFVITANEVLSMRIVFTCSSEENFDMMSASVNGEWVVCGFGKADGVTEERTYAMAAGDTLTVIAQFVKDASVDGGRDCAEVTFDSAGDFSISKTDPANVIAAGGSTGGWPNMPLRQALTRDVLPYFPANVRSAIKPVKKISAITPYETAETEDTLWIPSRREYCKHAAAEKTGVTYSGTFDGTVYPIARGGFWQGTYCWTRSRGTDNFYSITNPAGEANEMPQTLRGIILGFCI